MRALTQIALLLAVASTVAWSQVADLDSEARRLVDEGLKLIEDRRFSEAVSTLERAGKLAPRDALVPFYLAQCELNLAIEERYDAHLERARQHLRRARELDPEFGGTSFVRGLVGIQATDYDEAAEGFRDALRKGFNPRLSRINLAETLFLMGRQLADREGRDDPGKVVPVVEEAMRRFRDLKDDGRINYVERRGFEARWFECQIDLVKLHRRAGSLAKAREILADLVRVQPGTPVPHYLLGLLAADERDWKGAREHQRRALEVAPAFLEPRLELGRAHLELGEKDQAEEHLRAYLEALPDSPEGHRALGDLFVRTDRPARAADEYGRCVEIDSDALSALEALGDALRGAGREVESRKWLALHGLLVKERESRGD